MTRQKALFVVAPYTATPHNAEASQPHIMEHGRWESSLTNSNTQTLPTPQNPNSSTIAFNSPTSDTATPSLFDEWKGNLAQTDTHNGQIINTVLNSKSTIKQLSLVNEDLLGNQSEFHRVLGLKFKIVQDLDDRTSFLNEKGSEFAVVETMKGKYPDDPPQLGIWCPATSGTAPTAASSFVLPREWSDSKKTVSYWQVVVTGINNYSYFWIAVGGQMYVVSRAILGVIGVTWPILYSSLVREVE